MKITKSQLRQIIKEAITREASLEWSAEKWAELLNNILHQKALTASPLASLRNVTRVADYLAKNNITPAHFKQSKMGSKYLDRTTLSKAGWPLTGGGDSDVATVVANVLMDPK